MNDFSELLQLWPNGFLAERLGVTWEAVSMMKKRNTVSVRHWPILIHLAGEKGIKLNADMMMQWSTVDKVLGPTVEIPHKGKAR